VLLIKRKVILVDSRVTIGPAAKAEARQRGWTTNIVRVFLTSYSRKFMLALRSIELSSTRRMARRGSVNQRHFFRLFSSSSLDQYFPCCIGRYILAVQARPSGVRMCHAERVWDVHDSLKQLCQ